MRTLLTAIYLSLKPDRGRSGIFSKQFGSLTEHYLKKFMRKEAEYEKGTRELATEILRRLKALMSR